MTRAAEWLLLAGLLGGAAVAVVAVEATEAPLVGYRGLAALFLAVTGAFCLRLLLRWPERIGLWIVFLFFSVLFFCADALVRVDAEAAATLPSERFRLAIEALLLVAAGLAASRAAYGILASGRRGWESRRAVCARVQSVRPWLVVAAVGTIWVLRAYAASQGLVISHARDVMVSVEGWTSLLIQLTFLARPLLLLVAATLLFDRRPSRRLLGAVVVAAETVNVALWARRQIVEAIVVVGLAGLWAGRRPRARHLAALGGAAVLVLALVWPFMYHLRTAADRTGLYWADPAVRFRILVDDTIPLALSTFDIGQLLDADGPYVENVRGRASTIEFLVEVLDARYEGREVMGGRALAAALVASVPRLLWPGKERLLETETWQVEELIQSHFGFPIVDTGSTVLTQGYADGGVPGVLVYGALLGLLLGLCERAARRSRCAVLGFWIYGLGAVLAVQIEANVTDIFALARVVVPLLVVDRVAGTALEQWLASPPAPRAWGLRPRLT